MIAFLTAYFLKPMDLFGREEARRQEAQVEQKKQDAKRVVEQAIAVSQTSIIRGSWAAGRDIALHGWIYDLADGRLRDLNVTVTSAQEADELHARSATAAGD